MDQIRTCDVYPTIRCNCFNVCRIQEAEKEQLMREAEKQEAKQKFIDDLVRFQFYLRDAGYINEEDWTYEDEAIKFYNQTKAYEGN